MGPEIYKVMQMGEGFLAVMAKPVAGEWIEDEFAGIAKFGVKAMVSLLEQHEIKELGLGKAAQLCESHGMQFVNFPIADRGLPTSPKIFSLVEDIHRRILRGENTVIHCRAGIGRTGLLAASVLVRHGHAPDDAFKLVSKSRGVQVPDTAEQHAWVASNQKRLQLPC